MHYWRGHSVEQKLFAIADAFLPPQNTEAQVKTLLSVIYGKQEEYANHSFLDAWALNENYIREFTTKGLLASGWYPYGQNIGTLIGNNLPNNIQDVDIRSVNPEFMGDLRYDVVFFPHNSLSLFGSPQLIKSALLHAKQLLKDNGSIVVHAVNYKVRKALGRYYPLRETQVADQNIIVQRFLDFSPQISLNVNVISKIEEKWKYLDKMQLTIHPLNPKNLHNLANSVGLRVHDIFEAYTSKKFDEKTSKSMLALLRRQ